MTRLGAILAGGRSSRFGSDKGEAMLDGRRLVDHVVASLNMQCDELVIVGREWPGLTSLADRPYAGEGPLGGLCAALHYASAHGHDEILCAGCDTLPVPPDLAERLAPGPAVVDGHWLLGLWPAALAGDLDRWLACQQDRAIRAWMRHAGARTVQMQEIFVNINTPDALAQARALLDGRQS